MRTLWILFRVEVAIIVTVVVCAVVGWRGLFTGAFVALGVVFVAVLVVAAIVRWSDRRRRGVLLPEPTERPKQPEQPEQAEPVAVVGGR